MTAVTGKWSDGVRPPLLVRSMAAAVTSQSPDTPIQSIRLPRLAPALNPLNVPSDGPGAGCSTRYVSTTGDSPPKSALYGVLPSAALKSPVSTTEQLFPSDTSLSRSSYADSARAAVPLWSKCV